VTVASEDRGQGRASAAAFDVHVAAPGGAPDLVAVVDDVHAGAASWGSLHGRLLAGLPTITGTGGRR
jgi:hypothetical protein